MKVKRAFLEKRFWTKERCIEEAKKYKSKTEWSKFSSSSHSIAYKKGWFNECVEHMIPKTKPKGYWTKEKCLVDALKYTTKKEWQKNSKSAYCIAHKRNWLNECSQHMISIGNSYNRAIYAVEFNDNFVYIGLTHDIKERIVGHFTNEKSAVYKHIQQTNIQPIVKQLTPYLSHDLAIKKEEDYLNFYKNLNWTILNVAKTGALGGANIFWTKERCIEDALKYSTKKEWYENSNPSYQRAHKMKWLSECSKHMKPLHIKKYQHYTLDICKELASKFTHRVRFKEAHNGAYAKILKENWQNECLSHMTYLHKQK